MSEDRQAYAARRAREERELADLASDDRVRGIHLEMAIRYEILANGGVAPVSGDEPD